MSEFELIPLTIYLFLYIPVLTYYKFYCYCPEFPLKYVVIHIDFLYEQDFIFKYLNIKEIYSKSCVNMGETNKKVKNVSLKRCIKNF